MQLCSYYRQIGGNPCHELHSRVAQQSSSTKSLCRLKHDGPRFNVCTFGHLATQLCALRKPCMLPETETSTSENMCQQYLDSAEVAGSIGAVQGVSTVVALQALLLTAPPHLPLLVPAGATPAYNTAVVIHIPYLILALLTPAGKKSCIHHRHCNSHPIVNPCHCLSQLQQYLLATLQLWFPPRS